MLKLSSPEVSAEDCYYEEVSLILIAVKIFILLYNHSQYEISQLPSVIINFDVVLLLDTQYIHFSVLVAWPAHSLLTELTTQLIFKSRALRV